MRADDGHPVDLRCSVMVLRDEAVLLCRRTDVAEGLWIMPGGTPRRGEGSAAAACRETAEETGIRVSAEGVAFVLDSTSWDRTRHQIEIVFLGEEVQPAEHPRTLEPHLEPAFVPLADLDHINLRPPLGGYIRGFARSRQATAGYLGNLWRADLGDPRAGSQDV